MALKDTYLTISEAAKEARVTRQTVSRWVSEDKLPAEKIGRETLIEKKVFEAFRKRRFAETFDKAIIIAFIEELRKKYRYSRGDEIRQIGNDLVFDIVKKDGTHEIAEVLQFELDLEPTKVKITPYKESRKKGGK